MRDRLGQVILAVGRRDAERLATHVIAITTPLQPVNTEALASDLSEMLDLYTDVPLGDLSLRDVFRSITELMARHRLRLPADVLLLIKSISTIESVGCSLDPSFRIVDYATPHVEDLLAGERRPSALARRAVESGHEVFNALATIPANLAGILDTARRDGWRVEIVHRNLDHFIREMDRSSNRLSFAIVIAAIVVASAIMVHAGVGPTAFGYPLLGLIGFLTAGWLGIGLAIGILKSGKL
jgi:ubiquinone biosynthesis protein